MTPHINDALAYFRRMEVEPTPYGLARWIERQFEQDGGFDHKYFRRLVEALITICQGFPALVYEQNDAVEPHEGDLI